MRPPDGLTDPRVASWPSLPVIASGSHHTAPRPPAPPHAHTHTHTRTRGSVLKNTHAHACRPPLSSRVQRWSRPSMEVTAVPLGSTGAPLPGAPCQVPRATPRRRTVPYRTVPWQGPRRDRTSPAAPRMCSVPRTFALRPACLWGTPCPAAESIRSTCPPSSALRRSWGSPPSPVRSV